MNEPRTARGIAAGIYLTCSIQHPTLSSAMPVRAVPVFSKLANARPAFKIFQGIPTWGDASWACGAQPGQAVIERVFEADEFPDQGIVATEGTAPLG